MVLTPLIVWLISVAIYNYVYTINTKPITIESMILGHEYDVHQTEQSENRVDIE